MIVIDLEKCQGCRICVKNCPIGAIEVINKKAKTKDNCVVCGICYRVCTFEAIKKTDKRAPENITCTHCPVKCSIPPGKTGACKRYTHIDGELIRNRKLVIEGMASKPKNAGLPYKPLITAVGSGTNYPCSNPAPYIVNEHIDGVDVITVVTEAPLSYSGVKVKIDTNFHIGDEGARVRREGKVVGMVTTEEYGSKMLTIGGANLISGSNDGFVVVRTIVDLVNGRRVKLKIEKGSRIEIQQGMPPIIDGQEEKLMRVGCGSATVGVFARQLSKVVDEAIILDYHIIGLLSEHMAGKAVGMEYSGVIPYGRKSTDGRYFGKPGHGWGGTEITKPQDAIKAINMDIARPGMKILVTETTGQKSALFELKDDGDVVPIDLPSQIKDVIKIIADTCEKSIVSVVYTGGTGGSARGGVTNLPKALTDAIHDEEAKLSIAGAPTYVLPGGGINFMVDVSKMVPEPLTWVPTPATVAPVEYTMTKDKYEEIGGHINRIMSKQELIEKIEKI